MEWHNDQSGSEHSDEQSGDDQGRVEGPGGWQGNEWLDPADPHPVPQRERRSEETMDPDYEPEQRQEARTGRSKRRRRSPSPTEEDNESSGPDITSSDSQNKSRRGQRGRNQYPEGQFMVNAISPAGEPIDPTQLVAKFHNAIEAIIRKKSGCRSNDREMDTSSLGKKRDNVAIVEQNFCFPPRN